MLEKIITGTWWMSSSLKESESSFRESKSPFRESRSELGVEGTSFSSFSADDREEQVEKEPLRRFQSVDAREWWRWRAAVRGVRVFPLDFSMDLAARVVFLCFHWKSEDQSKANSKNE